MKVTENLVTKDYSKLVSAILADQVNRHQQLLLTWECPDVETAGMVERFIRHFDTPVACVEKRVEFSFPLLSLKELIARVKERWENDQELIASLEQVYHRHQIIWRAGRFTFDLTEQPVIYGILNVTPDSFYDGGKFQSHSAIASQIAKMVAAGANVIEVGGQTTKPGGFKEVDPEEEIARIMPAIQLLRENYPQIVIAVDTYKLPVMAAAIKAGVDIINDVHLNPSFPAVPLKKFQDEPFMVMRQNNDTRDRVEAICKRANISLNVTLKLNQLMTVYHLLKFELGASFVSDTIVKCFPSNDTVLYYKLDDPAAVRDVYLFYRRNRYLTRSMEEFMKIVLEEQPEEVII